MSITVFIGVYWRCLHKCHNYQNSVCWLISTLTEISSCSSKVTYQTRSHSFALKICSWESTQTVNKEQQSFLQETHCLDLCNVLTLPNIINLRRTQNYQVEQVFCLMNHSREIIQHKKQGRETILAEDKPNIIKLSQGV